MLSLCLRTDKLVRWSNTHVSNILALNRLFTSKVPHLNIYPTFFQIHTDIHYLLFITRGDTIKKKSYSRAVFLALPIIVLSGPFCFSSAMWVLSWHHKVRPFEAIKVNYEVWHFICFLFFFILYWLVEKDTLTGWFILKVKWAWWMVSKKALLNPDTPFFYEL